MHFCTTLLNNTPFSDYLGTPASLLNIYRICDVRRVTSVDPCIVLLSFVLHQESKRSFQSYQPNIFKLLAHFFCSEIRVRSISCTEDYTNPSPTFMNKSVTILKDFYVHRTLKVVTMFAVFFNLFFSVQLH